MTDVSLFGRPTSGMYDDLRGLNQEVAIAWLEGQAFPDRQEEILTDLRKRIKQVTEIAIRHLAGALERADRKDNAMERALDAAETRIRSALGDAHIAALLGETFNPHGFYVYCLWGTDVEAPMYVGRSTNVLARLGTHLQRRGSSVVRVTVQQCRNFNHMCKTEDRLIARFQPPWNIMGINPR